MADAAFSRRSFIKAVAAAFAAVAVAAKIPKPANAEWRDFYVVWNSVSEILPKKEKQDSIAALKKRFIEGGFSEMDSPEYTAQYRYDMGGVWVHAFSARMR